MDNLGIINLLTQINSNLDRIATAIESENRIIEDLSDVPEHARLENK